MASLLPSSGGFNMVSVLLSSGSCNMAPSTRWSEVPIDILCLIQESLPLVEYIRFGGVCRQWQAAAKLQLRPPAPQPPWLMFPNPGDPNRRTINCVSASQAYAFRAPVDDFYDRVFLGSSNGWLVTVNRSAELHLLNPLTGTQFQLPPLSTLPFVVKLLFCEGSLRFLGIVAEAAGPAVHRQHSFEGLRVFFRKAVVVVPHASSPSSMLAGGYTVAIIAGAYVAIARVNDERWTTLTGPHWERCCDIIYHDGLLHVMDAVASRIVTWDLATPTLASKVYDCRMQRAWWDKQCYLVESAGDLLLAVESRQTGTTYVMPRWTFQVFRLDRDREAWEQVRSLSDRSLFLGLNESMSFSSTVLSELSANSIYLTEGSQAWVAPILDREAPTDPSRRYPIRRLLASYKSEGQRMLPRVLWFTPNTT